MKNEYGLRKLVLINSANYEIAEIPLDDAVSIVGPNNSGKTSLINAFNFCLFAISSRWTLEPMTGILR